MGKQGWGVPATTFQLCHSLDVYSGKSVALLCLSVPISTTGMLVAKWISPGGGGFCEDELG